MYGPKWPFLLMYMSHDIDVGTCCILGRAPRTKETLLDFREWCRVTRHPRVFRVLKGCQRTSQEMGHRIGCQLMEPRTSHSPSHLFTI